MRAVYNGCVRYGFTLIELVVVISIIALLLVILIPALGRAREQVKIVSCQANARQIGQIVAAYQTDNDGRVPVLLNRFATGGKCRQVGPKTASEARRRYFGGSDMYTVNRSKRTAFTGVNPYNGIYN